LSEVKRQNLGTWVYSMSDLMAKWVGRRPMKVAGLDIEAWQKVEMLGIKPPDSQSYSGK
jgi:hypothetical protein